MQVSSSLGRRASLFLLLGLAVACSRRVDARCEFCGMKIEPNSPWTSELVGADESVHRFDTPKCALLAWKSGRVAAKSSRFQEFYGRAWRDGADLRFAIGSDVIGPMGGDAVPVAPERAAKFATDHAASRVAALGDLSATVLQGL